MPLFDFQCPVCGEKLEVLARTAEGVKPPTCPGCGVPMEKQWAPVAAHTRGGDAGCAPRGGFS